MSDSTASVFVSIASGPSGATLFGQTTVNANGGVAAFGDLALDRGGSYTLKTQSPGLTTVVSGSFSIAAGAPATLAWRVQPSNVNAGSPITPAVEVEVRDVHGNRAPATVAVTMSIESGPSNSTLSGTRTVNSSNGVAVFSNLALDRVGNYSLRASAGSLTHTISNTFTVASGSPSKIVFTVQPSNTTAGQVISPSVSIALLDSFDNVALVNNRSVTLSINSGPPGSTLGGTTTVNTTAGTASYPTIFLNTAGTYTLLASGTNLTSAVSTSFSIAPASPNRLAF
ncbi:MAG: hemagglutinin, partial [Myxococcales bacterium]